MGRDPKHHHYIPQCYLRGFASREGKAWRTEVTNLQTGQSFTTSVRNVAGERDFNRVDVEGVDPNYIEKQLAKIDDEFAGAIRRIEASRQFHGEDKLLTLNVIALLASRRPDVRENMRSVHEQVAKRIMDLALASKERWEGQIQQMRRSGARVNDDVSYEDMVAFHRRGEYTVEMNREHQIGLEWNAFDTVVPLLLRRKWQLVTSDEETGAFITCDRPVVLVFKEPEKVAPLYRRSPGFGLRNTEVVFPLSERTCLIGDFEGEDKVEVANEFMVASINTLMIEFAVSQVFMRKRLIRYMGPGYSVYRDSHFYERFSAWWKIGEDRASGDR